MQKLKTPDNLRPARYPLGTSDQYLKIAACNFAFTLNMNVSIKPQGKLKSIVVKLQSSFRPPTIWSKCVKIHLAFLDTLANIPFLPLIQSLSVTESTG